MYKIRRHDLAPRVEMLPLIDVIFLLLTFFIYSLIFMVKAQLLPVELTPVRSGQSARHEVVQAITIDAQGQLYFNRKRVSLSVLQARLKALAQDPDAPTLFIALQSQSTVDRGPILLNLIEQVRSAGITNFTIVGSPQKMER